MEPHETPDEESAEEAERREKIAALLLRRSALTEEEIALFDSIYDDIYEEHYGEVCGTVRSRDLHGATLDDMVQETFASFYVFVVDEGFPESIPAKLCSIAAGNCMNEKRRVKRDPATAEVPSSRSEPAKSSARGPERRMDLEKIRRVIPALSMEHQVVVYATYFDDKSQERIAEDLDISRDAVRRRLEAARRRLAELLAFLPESQRGTP